jgi:hypothetical protein
VHKNTHTGHQRVEHEQKIIKSLHSFSFLVHIPKYYLLAPKLVVKDSAHLVGVGVAAAARNNINISASLGALHPALLDEVFLLQHAAGLLHELAHGGVALAILGVVLRGLVAVAVESLLARNLIVVLRREMSLPSARGCGTSVSVGTSSSGGSARGVARGAGVVASGA